MPAPTGLAALSRQSEIATLQRQLEDASAAARAAEQNLAAEQAHSREIEQAAAQKSAQLDAALQDREQVRGQLRATEQDMAASRERASQREGELAGALTRVRELEFQIVQYRLTIERQRQNIAQHLQVAALLQSPSVKVVQLRSTEAASNANGVALIGNNNAALAFYASNLPALPARRVYQLWLIRSRGPAIVSGGLFSSGGGDLPSIEVRDAQLLAGLTGLAVTDEPVGGSPLPTGHKLLVGTPR
jgi:hypothetical protein